MYNINIPQQSTIYSISFLFSQCPFIFKFQIFRCPFWCAQKGPPKSCWTTLRLYSHIPSREPETVLNTSGLKYPKLSNIYFVNLDPTPVAPSFFAYPTIYCKNTAFSNRVRRKQKHIRTLLDFFPRKFLKGPGREHLGNLRHDGVKKASWCDGDSGTNPS